MHHLNTETTALNFVPELCYESAAQKWMLHFSMQEFEKKKNEMEIEKIKILLLYNPRVT